MSDLENRDDELIDALRRLPREMTPPSHVAASLVARFPRRSAAPMVWRAAIAASLVMAGFAAGRATAPGQVNEASAGQEFALLLYGGTPSGGDDRAAEYGAWVMDLRRAGRQVSGERLANDAWTAGMAATDLMPLRGFFLLRARDSAEAIELARQHPHARDGTVVVRPIDTP
jgi:hypothetical protein